MDRIDLLLFLTIVVVIVGASIALLWSGARAAEAGPSGSSSVFTITDPTRGLYNMHPLLVVEDAR